MRLLITAALLATVVSAPALAAPKLAQKDRIRIAEAFRLSDEFGKKLWDGWDDAPFAVLLVTADNEFLIRHPEPTGDFKLVGEDELLGGKVWVRPRTYPVNFQATFPAVGGVLTIVIGQAENTESKTSSRWIVTLLHEHFHQLQYSRRNYFKDVDALGLSGGDTTGMWMLNYPFPYDSPQVAAQFSVLADLLRQALAERERKDFYRKLANYLDFREKFRVRVDPAAWKYFEFQIWQEGIARYTEYRLAELAGRSFKPGRDFKRLPDYVPLKRVAREILAGMESELGTVELAKAGRTVVYNFGGAEGLLLDEARPEWRRRYFAEKFSLGAYFRTKD